jgi:hypothetical protein
MQKRTEAAVAVMRDEAEWALAELAVEKPARAKRVKT